MQQYEEIVLTHIFKNSPWIDMSDIDWSCITNGLTPKAYKKNEVVYQQDSVLDYLYLVKSGRIRLDVYSTSGEKKSIFIAVEGSLFGELSAIDGIPNICNAIAASNSLLYSIPKQLFIDALHTNNEFCFHMLVLMAKKMRLMVSEIKQLSFNDSYYKVCYALCHLIKQYATPAAGGYRLSIKFTHQEMGHLTGLSRVSVSNIFSNMAAEGILEKQEGYILVKKLDTLHQYLIDNT